MINRLIYIYISIWFTNFNIECSAAMQSYLFWLVLNNFIFNLGLQRRIRHESPFALYVNCRNHRLALCLVHLIKKYPVLQEIDSLLISLWKLFEFSPQKMAVFKNIQSVYGKEPLTFLRAATTRWLSHLHECSRFVSR